MGLWVDSIHVSGNGVQIVFTRGRVSMDTTVPVDTELKEKKEEVKTEVVEKAEQKDAETSEKVGDVWFV